MKHALALSGLALTLQGMPALAEASTRIATIERGAYTCETGGDAASQRGVPVPTENFTITNGSSYTAEGKTGTYLRVGNTVTMTSGPHKGARYVLKNEQHLRKLGADGSPSGLRCVRRGPNGS